MAVTISGTTGVGVSTTPLYPSDILIGSVGTTAGAQVIGARLTGYSNNADILDISNVRGTAGTDWQTAGWRIQQKIDATWKAYIQFNGTASGINNSGISFGTGDSTVSANSVTERMRIDGSGNVGIGAAPLVKLDVFQQTGNDNTLASIRISTNVSPGDQYGGRFATGKSGTGVPYVQVMGPKDPNGWLAFTTGSSDTERLRIHASGGVSIGATTDPGFAGLRLGRQDSTIEGGQVDLCRAGDNAIAWSIDAYGTGTTNAGSLRMVDATLGLVRAGIDSAGVFSFNSGYGSSAPAYGCRAWVNFNGTGTVAINGDGNVSTITDSAVGNYVVNLTTALVDINYAIVGAIPSFATSGGVMAGSSRTTSTFGFNTVSNGAYFDTNYVQVAVFR